jgi:formylglycine-generating enzyme required for sulfatase activity
MSCDGCGIGQSVMKQVMAIMLGFLAVSGAQAEPLDVFRDCDVCPEMIELPMGEFVMGAPEDEFRTIAYVGYNEEGRLA